MIGLSRYTGQPLRGWALFTELAEDALSTALGSREKRRDYGSQLPALLSQPQSDSLLMQAQIHAAEAFSHPPNNLSHLFQPSRIQASRTPTGLRLQIHGDYTGPGQPQAATFEVRIDATG